MVLIRLCFYRGISGLRWGEDTENQERIDKFIEKKSWNYCSMVNAWFFVYRNWELSRGILGCWTVKIIVSLIYMLIAVVITMKMCIFCF